MEGRLAQGIGEGPHLSWHINCLEIRDVFLALKHFLPDLWSCHVLVWTDKTLVVSYINHQVGVHVHAMLMLVQQILLWAYGKLILLRAVYIPGHRNFGAVGSRRSVKAWAEAPGLATQPSSSGVHMAEVQQGGSGLVCPRGVNPLSPVVFSPSSSSSGIG